MNKLSAFVGGLTREQRIHTNEAEKLDQCIHEILGKLKDSLRPSEIEVANEVARVAGDSEFGPRERELITNEAMKLLWARNIVQKVIAEGWPLETVRTDLEAHVANWMNVEITPEHRKLDPRTSRIRELHEILRVSWGMDSGVAIRRHG